MHIVHVLLFAPRLLNTANSNNSSAATVFSVIENFFNRWINTTMNALSDNINQKLCYKFKHSETDQVLFLWRDTRKVRYIRSKVSVSCLIMKSSEDSGT